MKKKNKIEVKKKKIDSGQVYKRKLKLSEIDELSLLVSIVNREEENRLVDYIKANRGVVLSRHKGKGVSRASMFSGIGAYSENISCVISVARNEEIRDLAYGVSQAFDLGTPGKGKSFVIESIGYMGAKALFI